MVDPDGDARCGRRIRQPLAQGCAAFRQGIAYLVVSHPGQGGNPSGHGQRIAGQGTSLVHRADGGDHFHDLPFTAVGSYRQAAANDFAEARDVGVDAVQGLAAALGGPEAGHDFVDNEQAAVAPGQVLDCRQISVFWQDEPHIAWRRLHDDSGDVSPFRGEDLSSAGRSLKGTERVVAAVPFVTPGLSGTPNVDAPEPAWTSRESLWPW